jgi:hypothetical protein
MNVREGFATRFAVMLAVLALVAASYAGTPTADPFLGRDPDLGSPVYSGAFAITPGVALPFPPRAIYVGGAGAIAMTGQDGNAVTFAAVPVGAIIPFRAASVQSSGTTATNLLGLY